jgi:hypothetical protein
MEAYAILRCAVYIFEDMKSGFVVLVAGICVVGGKKGGLCMLLTNLCSP